VFWILLLYMPILAFTAGLLEYVDFVDLVAGDDAWGRDLLPGLFLFPLQVDERARCEMIFSEHIIIRVYRTSCKHKEQLRSVFCVHKKMERNKRTNSIVLNFIF
jgi:hypothetical protein